MSYFLFIFLLMYVHQYSTSSPTINTLVFSFSALFIARLARSRHLGEPLSPTVLRTLTAHIVLGGISTTTNLLGSILLRLLREHGLRPRDEPRLLLLREPAYAGPDARTFDVN